MTGRLLLVDDEPEVRTVLGGILQREGLTVTLAENGAEAIRTLETLGSGAFDFILCDVRMPAMSGLEFLRLATAMNCTASIILMSGYATVNDAVEAMKLGAYDYISKPVNFEEVTIVLKRAEERARLIEENQWLRGELQRGLNYENLVTQSGGMKKVAELLPKAANGNAPVLIEGERGTGKSLIAKIIHANSPRSGGPFITVNCSLPQNTLLPLLFGPAQGDARRQGGSSAILEAEGGTLYLEEIERMGGESQLRLEVELLKSTINQRKSQLPPCRIICSTTKVLEKEVKAGRFRERLFYLLNILRFRVPPLRERREDIPFLAGKLLELAAARHGKPVARLSSEALDAVIRQPWRGNVAELENLLGRVTLLAEGQVVGAEEFRPWMEPDTSGQGLIINGDLSVKRVIPKVESMLIREALRQTNGNKTAASKLLEMSMRALIYKTKQMNID